MTTLVETLYAFVGVPTTPIEALLLYTLACILACILLSYGLRILAMMVGAVKQM